MENNRSFLIMRHGDYLAQSGSLSFEGRALMQKTGSLLEKMEIKTIYHSQTLRAKESAEFFAQGYQKKLPIIETSLLTSEETLPSLLTFLKKLKELPLLITHLPVVQQLLANLLNVNPSSFKIKSGSTLYLFESQGEWKIEWILSPNLLACFQA